MRSVQLAQVINQRATWLVLLVGAVSLGALAFVAPAPAAVTPTISVVSADSGVPSFGSLQVNGDVLASEPDGDGGFLVVGSFSCIGPTAARAKKPAQCTAPNTPAHSLARIRQDGTIDPALLPKITESAREVTTVEDLSVTGSEIRLVGNFESVDGQPRSGAAALALTGELKSWAPRFEFIFGRSKAPGSPSAIDTASDGSSVIAGPFDFVNGTKRPGLARIDADGKQTSSASPFRRGLDALLVSDVARMGTRTYVTGAFTVSSRGKRTQRSAIAVSQSGRLLGWRPFKDAKNGALIFQVQPVGERVIFGGVFDSANGKARTGLAEFDSAGSLTGWNPRLGSRKAGVVSLAALGNTVIAGGIFNRVNNVRRSNLAAIGPDAKATGWAPRIPESDFVVVAGSDDRVLIAYGD